MELEMKMENEKKNKINYKTKVFVVFRRKKRNDFMVKKYKIFR